MATLALQNRILSFWFHNTLGTVPAGSQLAFRKEWFMRSDEMDQTIIANFKAPLDEAIQEDKHIAELKQTPQGLLAAIILLDQFPRNVYRGTPQAFSGDAKALSLTRYAMAEKLDVKLHAIERLFVYLPLEHSEKREDQDKAVEQFEQLKKDTPEDPIMDLTLKYAVDHRDVIAKFGRFPHRNAILGRTSTDEELRYLADGGGF
ncbi:hypothetical protein IWQ60_002016 [Tieghemiomyces parasiticus]|uniref:DUF924 domain-containing protein n=1 Tax=Tieghemiomyces parasiticus TaxID=78921 RepID=A0A9W8DW30_9FUNG|nr:hypothetical protein IWQ60_002016 [Tieghemiomyces parasiticus]